MVTYIVIAVIILVAAIIFYRKKRKKEMAAGLQIFNADGKLILDYTERGYQIYGSKKITGGKNASGTITDSRIKAGSTFIIVCNITLDGAHVSGAMDEYHAQFMGIQPEFTITNGQITWRYGTAARSYGAYIGMTILYGGALL